MEKTNNEHLSRPNYLEIIADSRREGLQLGFDYREQIYKKSVSNIILADEKRNLIIQKMDKMICFLIDSVKNIKKTYNYSISRNSRDLN